MCSCMYAVMVVTASTPHQLDYISVQLLFCFLSLPPPSCACMATIIASGQFSCFSLTLLLNSCNGIKKHCHSVLCLLAGTRWGKLCFGILSDWIMGFLLAVSNETTMMCLSVIKTSSKARMKFYFFSCSYRLVIGKS